MEAFFQCEMNCANVSAHVITNDTIQKYDDCKRNVCKPITDFMQTTVEGNASYYAYENCLRNSKSEECVACKHMFSILHMEDDYPAEVCEPCHEQCSKEARKNSTTFDAWYECH